MPPLKTASQVCLPLTIKTEWAGKLVKGENISFCCWRGLSLDQMYCNLCTSLELRCVVCTYMHVCTYARMLWQDDDRWQETLLCSINATAIQVVLLCELALSSSVMGSGRGNSVRLQCPFEKVNWGSWKFFSVQVLSSGLDSWYCKAVLCLKDSCFPEARIFSEPSTPRPDAHLQAGLPL